MFHEVCGHMLQRTPFCILHNGQMELSCWPDLPHCLPFGQYTAGQIQCMTCIHRLHTTDAFSVSNDICHSHSASTGPIKISIPIMCTLSHSSPLQPSELCFCFCPHITSSSGPSISFSSLPSTPIQAPIKPTVPVVHQHNPLSSGFQ